MENQTKANSTKFALRLLMAAFANGAMFRSGVLDIFLGMVGLIVMANRKPRGQIRLIIYISYTFPELK